MDQQPVASKVPACSAGTAIVRRLLDVPVINLGFSTTPTEKGTILRRIYQDLKAEGVRDLHFLSNRGLLGTDGDGTVDGCHPNDAGMMRQATVLSQSLAALLGIPIP